MAGKDIVICPFGRKAVLEKTGVVKFLRNKTIGEAYTLLCRAGNYKSKNNIKDNIVEVMYELLNKN